MARLTKTTRGWSSPPRYIQGPGEFGNFKLYADKLGSNVAAIIDAYLYEPLSERLDHLYRNHSAFIRLFSKAKLASPTLRRGQKRCWRFSPP